MKAITIWQPYASLIMLGNKPFEFRTWKPPASIIGERVAIHAAKRKPTPEEIKDILWDFESNASRKYRLTGGANRHLHSWLAESRNEGLNLPFGAVLGTAILQAVHEISFPIAKHIETPRQEKDAPVYGWELTNLITLATPIEATGAQGFWNWNESGR